MVKSAARTRARAVARSEARGGGGLREEARVVNQGREGSGIVEVWRAECSCCGREEREGGGGIRAVMLRNWDGGEGGAGFEVRKGAGTEGEVGFSPGAGFACGVRRRVARSSTCCVESGGMFREASVSLPTEADCLKAGGLRNC